MNNYDLSLRGFYLKNKSIISTGLLFAVISAIIGVAFGFGVSQGEKLAIGELKRLENRIDTLEQYNKDFLSDCS